MKKTVERGRDRERKEEWEDRRSLPGRPITLKSNAILQQNPKLHKHTIDEQKIVFDQLYFLCNEKQKHDILFEE